MKNELEVIWMEQSRPNPRYYIVICFGRLKKTTGNTS